MAEQIELAKFNFDTDEVVKGAALIKREIDKIKKEQKDLAKEGKTSSARFVENQATLKNLNAEYNNHIKALSASTKKTTDATLREKKLEVALSQEATTINDLRAQNKLLNQLRNETNILTEEGRKELKLLNDKLNENNDLIKENVDELSQQKLNIGNYKDSIKEAFNEMNIFNGGFTGFLQRSKQAGGAGNLVKGSLKGMTQGFIGLTRASLAFIATPIGAVLAVLVGAFLLVKNAMNRSEKSMNKIKKAFAPFQGILNGVLKALEPLGEFLIDGIVKAMELAEVAIYKMQDALAGILDFLGFEKFANNVREFNEQLRQGAVDAKKLADAEAKLQEMQRKANIIQKEYQRDAEILRQIRDDETLTLKERIQANELLGDVLKQQLQDELRIAQQALIVANLRIKTEGKTTEALNEQAEALANIADIEERINGQRSEQLKNRVSLEKEARDKAITAASEAADKRIEKMNEELELFIAQQGFKKKTLADELELERQISDKKKKILEEELKSKKISQTAYETELLNLKNEFALKQAELLAQNAELEIEELRKLNEAKRQEDLFLSEERARQLIEDNNFQLQKEMEFFALKLEQGLINQDEYNQSINDLNEQNRIANEEIQKEREEVARQEALELRAVEFEQELQRLIDEGATKFEVEKAQREEQNRIKEDELLQQKEQGLISEKLYQEKLAQIKRNADRQDLAQKQILAQEKLQLTAGLLQDLSGLVDKQSAAGKAIAVAQAGINTYQGITEGLKSPYPLNIIQPIVAGAVGIKAVTDILKTKIPSMSSGGGGAGQTPSIRLPQTPSASSNPLIQETINQNATNIGIDETIGRSVEEGTRRGAEAGSQSGLTNLSENRDIQLQSTF